MLRSFVQCCELTLFMCSTGCALNEHMTESLILCIFYSSSGREVLVFVGTGASHFDQNFRTFQVVCLCHLSYHTRIGKDYKQCIGRDEYIAGHPTILLSPFLRPSINLGSLLLVHNECKTFTL